jgi:hypothetical protein
MRLPKIAGNKRIILNGKTRTGKSTMARYLLNLKANEGWWIVIIDPKRDWMSREENGRRYRVPYGELSKDFKGSVERPIYSDHFDPQVKVMIYEPTNWDANLDAIVDATMAHGYVIVYLDEVRQLGSSSKAPAKMVILYTQGAASNVGCWGGNQRPVGIPEDMKSQAEIWIVFYINKQEDKQKIASYLPYNDSTRWFVGNDLPYYCFLYYDDQMSGPIILPPLQLKGASSGKPREQVG